MLYSENELNKRLRSGCGLYYFYAADEALVHTAAQKRLCGRNCIFGVVQNDNRDRAADMHSF